MAPQAPKPASGSLRRSTRSQSPTKRSEQYRNGRAIAADKREDYERRQNVQRQREEASNHPKAPPKAKPQCVSVAVELPSPYIARTKKPLTNISKTNLSGKASTVGKELGKGNAPAAAKSGPSLPSVNNTASGSIPPHPGPRPESNDYLELGVLIEEWKRQRLIWYLTIRDKKCIPPNADYDDLNSVLGADDGWDSENERGDKKVIQRGSHVAAAPAPNATDQIGRFDKEPQRQKPIPVGQVQSLSSSNPNSDKDKGKRKATKDTAPPAKRPHTDSTTTQRTSLVPMQAQIPSAPVVQRSSTRQNLDSNSQAPRPDSHVQRNHQTSSHNPPPLVAGHSSNLERRAQPSSSTAARGVTSGPKPPAAPSATAVSSNRRQSQNSQADSQSTNHNNRRKVSNDKLDDEDNQEEATENWGQTGNRGRVKYYTGIKKSILESAGEAYKAIMVTKGMYETDAQILGQRRREAWRMACNGLEVNPADYPLTRAHIQSMTDRLVSWRGKANKCIATDVKYYFFGKSFPQLTTEQVYKYINKLKEGHLHMIPNSPRGKGHFRNPILQICMNKILFRDPSDIGVRYIDMFRKPTAELVAFFCSIVEHCCDRYAPDAPVKDKMNFDSQRKAYLTHLGSHQVWLKKRNALRWNMIQEKLFRRGLKHSRAFVATETASINKYMLNEDDVESDNPNEEELAAWEAEMEDLETHGRSASGLYTGPAPDNQDDDGNQTDEGEGYDALFGLSGNDGGHELEALAEGQDRMDPVYDCEDNGSEYEEQARADGSQQGEANANQDNDWVSWKPGETQMETDPNGRDADDEWEYTQRVGNHVNNRDQTLSSDYGDDYAPRRRRMVVDDEEGDE